MTMNPGNLTWSPCCGCLSWFRFRIAILYLMPVHFSFDFATITDNTSLLLETARKYLEKPVHCNAAALLICKLLVRKDMKELLTSFSVDAIAYITGGSGSTDTGPGKHYLLQGYICALASIFKSAPRLEIWNMTSKVLLQLDSVIAETREKNSIIRKMVSPNTYACPRC